MPQAMSKFKYEGVIYDIKDAKARQDLAECVNNGYYDSNAKKIILRHDSDIIIQIDATDFIKDGMVSNVQIINGYLVITFNTDSGQEPISIPITDIFNPDNYYNKSAINEMLLLKQNVIQDLAQIRQGAEAGASAYQKPQGGIPKTDMSDDVKESLEKADDAAPKTEVEEHYARKDGYYETLGAGTANNLKSDITTDREIMYDKSGGLNDIDSGSANLSRVQGNTVAWNNIMQNGNFETVQGWTVNNATFTISNNIATVTYGVVPPANYSVILLKNISLKQGHKYCIIVSVKVPHNGTFRIDTNAAFENIHTPVTEDTWTTIRKISTCTQNSGLKSFMLYPLGKDDGYTVGDSYSVKNVQLIDLTLIYGDGNEPTSVSQFEADYQRWFGKPLAYEPYDAGSLRSVKMSAIKTTGFNQCDEIFEKGSINVENGEKIPTPDTPTLRTKNFQRVLPNTEYYFPSFGAYVGIAFYDANKVFISGVRRTRGVVTTPSNSAYMMYSPEVYGTTYNHDICINISDPSKNGTYEPYKENVASLPITTLTGKLNGQGESVTIFPDGMKSAGNIHDEIFVDNGVVKANNGVGSANFVTSYISMPTQGLFVIQGATNGTAKIICSKYVFKDIAGVINNSTAAQLMGDGTVTYRHGDTNDRIYIKDSSYTTVEAFKAAMQNVMLYYELPTPRVYVLDDDILPLMYKVDELGTEQVLPECTEETPCCAPILSVNYAMNAVAQLRNMHTNYISKASFDNYLNLVNSTLVSVLGGTISVNPTQTNDAYTFAFSEVSNMVVFVSNGSQITDVIGNFPPDSYINNGKAKFYLRHDNALIPLSVAYTGSITAVGVYSPYGSNDTYTVRFSGAYSTSIIGATVNVEQIN